MLVRGDGSTAHEGFFDTDTGEFLRQTTHQGYRGDSCWSRGLELGHVRLHHVLRIQPRSAFLETAQACADFYITHSPSDGVPPWDFNAPAENRTLLDTSAAAIYAAGLLRLCRLVPDSMKGHLYWSTAVRILAVAVREASGQVRSQVGRHPQGRRLSRSQGLGVDESVMWGEYFFCEALERAMWKSS